MKKIILILTLTIVIIFLSGCSYKIVKTESSLAPAESTANSSSTVFYTQSVANVRSCPSTTCTSLGTYPVNTDLSLPYATVNDLPEWIEFSLPNSLGVTQNGFINKITLGENKVDTSEKINNQIAPVKNGYQTCSSMNATWDGTLYTSNGGFDCTCKTDYILSSNGKSCVIAPKATNTTDDYNNCLAKAKADYLGSWATACSNSYIAYTQCYQEYGDIKDYCKQTYGGWQNSPTCSLAGGSGTALDNSYEADKNRCATVYGHN